MKITLTTLIVMLLSYCARSQNWSSSLIPSNLRQNANSVIRLESSRLDIKDAGSATLRVHKVCTILNKKGENELSFTQYLTRYIKLRDVEIKLYDSLGIVMDKFKRKDVREVSYGEGLIEDGMLAYMEIHSASFPVTMELDMEIQWTGLLNPPSYFICGTYQSVQNSQFSVRVPADIGLRYLAKNIPLKPQISTEGTDNIYSWQVNDLEARAYEEGGPEWIDCIPKVMLSLDHFSFYDKKGEMSSWQKFGIWMRDLYQGLNELPAPAKARFAELVRNEKDDLAKARIIYEYLQRNFRYVSIQLGLGGFVPFSAEFTDQKKYGDCKGLSNYMQAALKSVGIRSHVALVNAGYNNEPIDPTFPTNDFNHMILCIPQPKDTVWLECTSSSSSFGELGSFTENRYALLITEAGGILVPTPKSTHAENIYHSYTTIKMSEEDENEVNSVFHTRGRFRSLMDNIYKEKSDEQKEAVVKMLGFKVPDELEMKQVEGGELQVDSLNLLVEKIHEFKAGNKYFLAPRLNRIWAVRLPVYSQRKTDYYFEDPFTRTDTTVYILPAGFKTDALPEARNLDCGYATYSSRSWYDEKQNKVFNIASLLVKKQRIPATDYSRIQQFFDQVLASEAQRLVVRSE